MLYAIKRSDGVSIMDTDKDINEQIAKWESGSGLTAISYRQILPTDLPDREFRNAWEDTGTITENLDKAKNIHADRIEKSLLEEETRITKENKRERLKGRPGNIPSPNVNLDAVGNQIKNAPNINALKNIWPNGVPK